MGVKSCCHGTLAVQAPPRRHPGAQRRISTVHKPGTVEILHFVQDDGGVTRRCAASQFPPRRPRGPAPSACLTRPPLPRLPHGAHVTLPPRYHPRRCRTVPCPTG